MTKAQMGDHVQVQYLEIKSGGKPVRQAPGRKVLEFTVGSDQVISGVSLGVVGMVEGQEKRLTLAPTEAYGEVRPKLIREVPRGRFPSGLDLHVGQRLKAKSRHSSRRRRAKVVELRPNSVVVDYNHRLAGEVLEVELQLVSLRGNTSED